MKFSGGLLTTALAAAAMGAGIVTAPPASAGCLGVDQENTYCDGPAAPDGTWQRCHETSLIVYQGGWVWKRLPPTKSCYRVDPSQPWAPTPAGQPQFHIDD
ncbi:CDGP domain-containing protein [Mycobacterium sp. Marseille-P9652]|uniref:CDGP domain-containing protein n=1 Tax=Mycobacterium sp. Marseille-P9652 TaxID=2654950 RepID=UPI00403820FF